MGEAGGVAAGQLRSIVERIERCESDKKDIADDIKGIYQEARSSGFDVKILRRIITLRKLDTAERQEQEAILDLYLSALGMKSSELDEAISAMGTPVEPTEEERKKGVVAAFEKDGTRMSIGTA